MTNNRFEAEINMINQVKERWNGINNDERCENLENIIKTVSNRIADMRKLFMKQCHALKKFHKEAGENWRESKFIYAISSVQAQIYQIRSAIRKLLYVNDLSIELGSTIRKSQNTSDVFSFDSKIDICTQENCIRLKDLSDMPLNNANNARFVKQRTEEWFDLRKRYRLTGSTLFAALGLDSLKKQQIHFDRVVKGIDIHENVSEEVQSRLEHGTKSEINALATLLSKFLPFYYPDLKYIEEGAHEIKVENKGFMLVSPDGSLCSIETNSQSIPVPLLGCEFKCPVPADYKTPVHYEVPLRYIPQILAEMASMGVDTLIYLCWSDESSTVFRAHFDADLWEMILNEVRMVFCGDGLKRPSRISEGSKQVAEKMNSYRNRNTHFLCEIPSVKGYASGTSQTTDKTPYLFPITHLSMIKDENSVKSIEMIMSTAVSAIQEVHELCRKKATEVLVWLISDTDRKWDPEIPHSTPVAYAMAGYSLPVKPMRDMHENILQNCHEKGLNIVCCCFDGQWLKIATRGIDNQPLTLIQLQRDVYDRASKVNRKQIVKCLSENPLVKDFNRNIHFIRTKANASVSVSCPKLNRLMVTVRRCSREETPKRQSKEEVNCFDAESLSCLPNDALETLISVELPNELSPGCTSTTPGSVESSTLISTDNFVEGCLNEETSAPSIQVLTDGELQNILNEFQSSVKKAVLKRWTGKTIVDVQSCIVHVSKLRSLSHVELNCLINASLAAQKVKGIYIKKSWSLLEKANALSKVIGNSEQIFKEKTLKHMKSLKELISNVVEKNRKHVTKQTLNNVYASMTFDDAYDKWLKSSPFPEKMQLDDIGMTRIFSYPEINAKRGKLEHRCVDFHHLFVNLRVKVCKDGLQGIRKKAWHHVAEYDNNIISKAIVCDLIDKQNNAYAKRTFSGSVESTMRILGYSKEADFCKLIREWYQAEDMPGISAVERCKRRLALKKYLLQDVDFAVYPLPGMYIKGFPKVMYEGFLQRIDTTFQLYQSVTSYNPRSVSSLVNETFFGELSELEPTKLGCPKAVSIPRLISTVTELQHYRSDPTRNFRIITTRKSVYPATELLVVQTESASCESTSDKQLIRLANHQFDLPERRRKKTKKI